MFREERVVRTPLKGYAKATGTRTRVLRRVQGMRKQRARIVSTIPRNFGIRGLQLDPGEFKSVDVTQNFAMNQTGALYLLNGIARGDDINERTGRQVILKSVELKCDNYITATTGVRQTQRVLVVYDSQTNATALTILQVLNAVTVISMKNLENRKRFQILLDKTLDLMPSGDERQHWKWYKKLNHQVQFNNGDAATVADIVTGSLYFITIGSNVAGVNAGTSDITVRVRYTDK